jgi:hypothetical protein
MMTIQRPVSNVEIKRVVICHCYDEFIDETTVDYDDNEFSFAIENLQQQFHRRDFLAWNSLFAGIFSGCIFPRGQPIPPSDAYPPFSRMSDYASPPNGEGGVPYQRPFSTVRRYKSITLFNGIKVLLVSDKNARVSSAAMTIRGAGQFSDPPFLSGLAHLMEHITLSSIVQSQLQKGDFEEWLQSDYADGLRP